MQTSLNDPQLDSKAPQLYNDKVKIKQMQAELTFWNNKASRTTEN